MLQNDRFFLNFQINECKQQNALNIMKNKVSPMDI